MKSKLENSLGYLVSQTTRVLINGLSKHFAAASYDVTVEQWRVMVNLWNRDGQTQQELSQATGKIKTSITRLIHGMEKRNLVIRVPDKNDRRQNLIYLTHKGKQLQNDLMSLAQLNQDEAQANIDPGDLETCKEVLRQVIRNMREPQE